jgi:PII-like signaling protein
MRNTTEATSLRLFIGESDEHEGRPLYEAIVLKARELGLAGATVLRGAMGYGHSSRLHTTRILRLSDDMPVLIEIVDDPGKIEDFLAAAEPMLGSCLVTMETVRLVRYGRDGGIPSVG